MTLINVRPLLFAGLAPILLYLFGLVLQAAPAVSNLPTLPRTEHAIHGHAGQMWTATQIATTMGNGGCGPVNIYTCPGDTYVYTCTDPKNSSRLLGLVVGRTSGRIVTGYTASKKSWDMDTDQCSSGGGPAYALP